MPETAEQAILLSYIKDLIGREKSRMDNADNRIHMLDDDFVFLIKTEMKEYVSEESWKKMECYARDTINVFSDVIDQLSEIYLDDPVREFSINEKTKGKKVEEIEEIYNKAKVNQIMERTNIYMNGVNDVILHPVIRNGQLEIDILTPNVVKVIERRDDPTKPWAIFIIKTNKDVLDIDREWIVWTETEHYILQANGAIRAIEGNEEMVNPYGILPFVFIHRKKSDGGFWNETAGDDLYQCTILVNAKQSLINFYFVWNSFKQISVAAEGTLPAGIVVSPDKVFQTPEGSVISILDYQIHFKALDENLNELIDKVAKRYGIDKASFGNTKELSGRALKIKNKKLDSLRKKQLKIFRDCEGDLLEVISVILFIEGIGDYRKMEIDIHFSEPEIFVEPKERLDIEEKEIELDLKSKVDVYMSRNKNIKTRKEAMEKLKEITKENNELKNLADESINAVLNKKEKEEEN